MVNLFSLYIVCIWEIRSLWKMNIFFFFIIRSLCIFIAYLTDLKFETSKREENEGKLCQGFGSSLLSNSQTGRKIKFKFLVLNE